MSPGFIDDSSITTGHPHTEQTRPLDLGGQGHNPVNEMLSEFKELYVQKTLFPTQSQDSRFQVDMNPGWGQEAGKALFNTVQFL